MQEQIDDINDRLDQNDSDFQDYQDTIQTNFDDTQTQIDDHSTSIDDLTQNAGQLSFPLTQDTIDLIKEQFPSGIVTLVNGQATITDARISAISILMLAGLGSTSARGILSYVASNGSATIYSTYGTDATQVAYLILN